MRLHSSWVVALALMLTRSAFAGPESTASVPRADDRSISQMSAVRYHETFRALCDEPVASAATRKDALPDVDRCEQNALDAADAFRQNGARGKAITLYRSLIAFDDHVDDLRRGVVCADRPCLSKTNRSPLAIRAHHELATSYEALGLFDLAAVWLETWVDVAPKAPATLDGLEDALRLRLRLSLGDVEGAERDVRRYHELAGPMSPGGAAQTDITLATFHAGRKDWPRTRAVLKPIRDLSRLPIDLQLRAHALLARSGVRTAEEYAWVAASYRPDEIESRLRQQWPLEGDEERARRLDETLAFVGEAQLHIADAKRRRTVDTLSYPTFSGSPDRTSLLAHVEKVVKPWLERRVRAIQAAVIEYEKVPRMHPVAPAAWTALAAARIALMWGDLVDAFDVPHAALSRLSLRDRAAYYDAIDELREPIRSGRAKPAALQCLVFVAVRLEEGDDPRGLRACGAWLASHFKAEHHVIDEIVPPLASPPDRPPPLRYDGSLLVTK